MVLFKFVKVILVDEFIDVFNYGEMVCDFIYVEDLVILIIWFVDVIFGDLLVEGDSLLLVVLFCIVNIGGGKLM